MEAMKNRVQLIGHVGQDPEVKSFEGGKKVANLNLATNDVYYKEEGEKVTQTEWHRVVAWGKLASLIEQYVTKGKELGITGKITYRNYEDKEGNKRSITEIVAEEVLFM
ncbi:single-stranded DNA-binding protein [Flavobacterium sp.]|uniref:single-stranded DNA-binding protein n=2 Tax=Flavobacterium sp. TaxID=239 RepID=UPI0022CA82A8|nr:single-stranded DNA-binding protein [Flavobacterium sp.]MCZ8144599.1 single-stranded DNA-binding protein [Flavobacterium sp.]MCZ8366671.1 single-stranded DNA-binding protein [Flavobacterium sp.]